MPLLYLGSTRRKGLLRRRKWFWGYRKGKEFIITGKMFDSRRKALDYMTRKRVKRLT